MGPRASVDTLDQGHYPSYRRTRSKGSNSLYNAWENKARDLCNASGSQLLYFHHGDPGGAQALPYRFVVYKFVLWQVSEYLVC